jgi:hypothetical protein
MENGNELFGELHEEQEYVLFGKEHKRQYEAANTDTETGVMRCMKAILKPLEDKYYGTEIELHFDDGEEKEVIKFWNSGDFEPSIRELERLGYTQEQWDKNEKVDNGCGGKTEIRKMDLICDSHFESRLTYERALKFLRLINCT